MVGVAGSPLVVGGMEPFVEGTPPTAAVGGSAIVDVPGPVRGAVAFVLVFLLGAALVRRFGPFLDRSVDASMERPLASLGYGAAAHAVIAFAGVYLADQLAGVPTAEWNAGVVGVVAGLLVVLLASALGFTVVGSAAAALWLDGRPWTGPLVGAALAGGSAAVEPLVGGLVWFVVVSTGIGGAVRRWIHASAGPDPSNVPRE